MNKDFFETLVAFEKEKGIESGYLVEKIKAAIIAAVKRGYGADDNIIVDIDIEKAKFYVAIQKTVVEEVSHEPTMIQIDEAKRYNKKAMIDDIVEIPIKTSDFGLLAAQAAKQIIRQGIREAERSQMFKELKGKSNEIVSATVLRIDTRSGNLTVDMGKYQSILPKIEQVENESFKEGEHIKVYVVDVQETEKGPKMIISRTNAGLVRRLFEMEVPEVQQGLVEIKSI
ncbi:MAG: NusA N-terminal domain-containing protein, partial [Oscillospiraceae bacterium]